MVVHQLAREEFDDAPKLSTKKKEQAEEMHQEFDDPPKSSTTTKQEQAEEMILLHHPPKEQAVEMISLKHETENYAPRRATFAGYKSTQFQNQPMNPTTLLQEIKSKKK
eukprot:399622_1